MEEISIPQRIEEVKINRGIVLKVDFSSLSLGQISLVCNLVKDKLDNYKEEKFLLVNIKNCTSEEAVISCLGRWLRQIKPHILKSAILGINNLQGVNFYQQLVGKANLYMPIYFKEDEALKWFEDRRIFPRFCEEVRVYYWVGNEEKKYGRTKDISMGGVCIFSDCNLEVGKEVNLEIFLPNKKDPISANGHVTWQSEFLHSEKKFGYALGIEFEEIAPKQRQWLFDYIFGISIK